MEDSIIEQMKLNSEVNVCSLPENVWYELYQAKCTDLGIPCRQDKLMERFLNTMLMN